jgi:hypothetical protein
MIAAIAFGLTWIVFATYCAVRAGVAFGRKRIAYGMGLVALTLALLSIPVLEVLVLTSGGV